LYGKHGGISQNRRSLPERGKTFDLTLEKQVKIRESLEKAFTLSPFKEILDAVSIKVPPCLQYQDNCALCPL